MKFPFVSRERFEALEHALAEEKTENRRLLDLLLDPLTKKEMPEAAAPRPALSIETSTSEKKAESLSPGGGTPMDRVVANMHQHYKGATPPAQWRARG
jgi:hypothetical protein